MERCSPDRWLQSVYSNSGYCMMSGKDDQESPQSSWWLGAWGCAKSWWDLLLSAGTRPGNWGLRQLRKTGRPYTHNRVRCIRSMEHEACMESFLSIFRTGWYHVVVWGCESDKVPVHQASMGNDSVLFHVLAGRIGWPVKSVSFSHCNSRLASSVALLSSLSSLLSLLPSAFFDRHPPYASLSSLSLFLSQAKAPPRSLLGSPTAHL